MPSFALSSRHLIAQQFNQRPSLRGILADDVLQVLLRHYPDIAREYPELRSANAFTLMYPLDAKGFVRLEPLMDALLRAFMTGKGMVLTDEHHLSLAPPSRFRAFRDPSGLPVDFPLDRVNVHLSTLEADINALLAGLVDDLRQAQFDHWQGTASNGVQRSHWVRQVLRLALSSRLPAQGLEPEQVATLRGLLLGGERRPTVHALQVELTWQGRSSTHLLPDLLVSSEQHLPGQVLWCSPAGLVTPFDSLDSFARQLRALLAERYAFDRLSWSRHALEGDAFARQAALMLETLLSDINQLQYVRFGSVAALEAAFELASDPAGWFSADDQSLEAGQSLTAPDWLSAASDGQRFAYQSALLALALAQGEAGVSSSQQGVLDLHRYASDRLRRQMLDDYPDEANYFPDDLLLHLTVAQGVGGGSGTGPGGGEPLAPVGIKTLTQFAIDNLASLGAAKVSRITHRDDQLIMPWMTPTYLYALVEKVDVGGHYPGYVADKLKDPVMRDVRVACFAREWRCRLQLDAVKAWVDGQISETAWRVIAGFCDSDSQNPPRRAGIAQLAFRREADAAELDKVQGMYVIRPWDRSLPGVLYRPLYAQQPLLEINGDDALLALIQQPGELQQSVLDWLAQDGRRVYEHGGFLEPHLGYVIDDSSILLPRPKPARIVLKRLASIDADMYDINTALLVELADRQSVSTAQSRWAVLTRGAWLLFDTVSLLVRGPVAVLLWAMQGVSALANDLEALRGESAFDRSAAVVDLLLNLGMVLLHARLPDASQLVGAQSPRALLGAGAVARVQGMPFEASLEGGGAQAAIERMSGLVLDHAFVGGDSLNGLSPAQRSALERLRSDIPLKGVSAQAAGNSAGLYLVDGEAYMRLGSGVYRVRRGEGVYDLVGPQGEQGPFISRVGGRWQLQGLRLAAGAPVDVSAQSKARMQAALQEDLAYSRKARPAKLAYARHIAEVEALEASTRVIEAEVAKAPGDLTLARQLQDATTRLRHKRVQALDAIEPMIEAARGRDKALGASVLARYADEDGAALSEQLGLARGEARFELLAYEEATLRYALLSSDYEGLHQLEAQIKGQPLARVAARYQQYRTMLEGAVAMQERALRVSKYLDQLIPQTANDTSVTFTDKDQLLATLKGQRRLTSVFIQAHQLADLATLAMRVDYAVSEAQLSLIERMLHGARLRAALASHGHLGFEGLSGADRLDILDGALDAYDKALVNVDLLIKTGGEVVETRWLEQYRQAMVWLREEAERALRVAVDEMQLKAPMKQPGAYDAPAIAPEVVQTIGGETILGERSTVNGVEVFLQRGQDGVVLDTYQAQGDGWVLQESGADLSGPSLPGADLAKVRAEGEALLGHRQWVIEEARRQAKGLSAQGVVDVIDGQLGLLADIAAQLGNDLGDADLLGRLHAVQGELGELRGTLQVEVAKATEFPAVKLLRELHGQGRLRVAYEGRRHVLGDGSALDKYRIYLRDGPQDQAGRPLWEAHLHYQGQGAVATAFDRGHLKAWKQRNLGPRDQLQARKAGTVLNIHRASFKLRDVQGILPLT